MAYSVVVPVYCHSRTAGMDYYNHWIPRPSFQTRLYHLGRLFPTRLYHLHPCRRASMQVYIAVGVDSSFRWNDDEAIDADWQPYSLNPCPPSFMDRKSCMRREGRMPGAAQRRLESTPTGMYAYRDVRLQGCTPTRMYAYKDVRLQGCRW